MSQPEIKGKARAAMLANVMALSEAIEAVRGRDPHLPGLVLMHGPSGYGKSVAATVNAIEAGAAYVEVRSTWTKRDLIEAVARELGVPIEKRMSKTAEAISAQLAESQRVLIVDEADTALEKGHLEILREFHMASGAPIVMIGEENFAAKVQRIERIANRILVYVSAQPASLDDARALAEMFCRRVAVADDLLAYLVAHAHGRIRRIVVNLSSRIEPEAVRDGIEVATRAWWGDRTFYTGEAPNRKVPA